MNTLAIIGSAGRGDDTTKMTAELYCAMCDLALYEVRMRAIDEATSGGAAFADHVAVWLFLNGHVRHLRLFLPAEFRNGQFIPNPRVSNNPGQTSNRYHAGFKERCGVDGLAEISEAIARGADVSVHHGFKRRNLEVADRATYMLAFTFGSGPDGLFEPDDDGFRSSADAGLKDGGTAHTWQECWKAKAKRHVNLNRMAAR